MKRVLIESPFGRTVSGEKCTQAQYIANAHYAKLAVMDSLRRGEAPFASHVLYPGVGLDDTVMSDRRLGMEAGFAWGEAAEMIAVYADHGITPGMREGIARWEAAGIQVEYRKIHV